MSTIEREVITRNAAWCGRCHMEIESLHVHDWKSCRCGDIFVDGGLAYRHHGWRDAATYRDISIFTTEIVEYRDPYNEESE